MLALLLIGVVVCGAALLFWGGDAEDGPRNIPKQRYLTAGQDAGYLDSAVCAGCHQDIWERYRHTGMARSFFRPTAANRVEDYSGKNSLYHAASDRYYEMHEKDGGYYQRRYQIGPNGEKTNIVEKRVDFVMGSGNHARSYLTLTRDSRLVQLPVAWYSENGGYWAMSPGYDRGDHQGFRREIGFDCMFCHNAYPEIEAGADEHAAPPIFPGNIPEGIGCQRCHGPGRDHVEAAGATAPDLETIRRTILNPAGLSAERQLEVCLQCHLESTSERLPDSIVRYDRGVFSYRPEEPLARYVLHFDHPPGVREDKFEINHAAYRLLKSACFQESGGEMTCTTCHDPHGAPRGEEATRHYTAVCRSCHSASLERLVAAQRHTYSPNCLGCHMPKRRTQDVVHVVMTDHSIRRRPPSGDLLAPLEERQASDGGGFAGEVQLHYPAEGPSYPGVAIYEALAQVVDGANIEKGLPQLRAQLDEHQPDRAAFYFELAEAYSQSGDLEQAVVAYQEALQRDPDYVPALQNLGGALARLDRLSEAVDTLRRALTVRPGDAAILTDLSSAYLKLQQWEEAARAAQRALAGNPDLPEASNNLGLARNAAGKSEPAEQAFREAIRMQPDYAAAHTHLATVLATQDRSAEAEYHFEKAIQLDPDSAQARFNFALELMRSQRYAEAKKHLRQTVKLDPSLAEAHNNLGMLFEAEGDHASAERVYRGAIKLHPGSARAHFGLANVLASRGAFSEAKQHFERSIELVPGFHAAHFGLGNLLAQQDRRDEASASFEKAAASADPRIRAAAERALEALSVTPSR